MSQVYNWCWKCGTPINLGDVVIYEYGGKEYAGVVYYSEYQEEYEVSILSHITLAENTIENFRFISRGLPIIRRGNPLLQEYEYADIDSVEIYIPKEPFFCTAERLKQFYRQQSKKYNMSIKQVKEQLKKQEEKEKRHYEKERQRYNLQNV